MSHQRYLYRGYLQIAALDLTRNTLNAFWYILWDPTESIATRPLAIQTAGSWFTYGLDLTKNVTELYKSDGTIANAYAYEPFGGVTQTGNITNPLQWSSEVYDAELGMVYYNFRFYHPRDGRWISRDPIGEKGGANLYAFVKNSVEKHHDLLGKLSMPPGTGTVVKDTVKAGTFGAAKTYALYQCQKSRANTEGRACCVYELCQHIDASTGMTSYYNLGQSLWNKTCRCVREIVDKKLILTRFCNFMDKLSINYEDM